MRLLVKRGFSFIYSGLLCCILLTVLSCSGKKVVKSNDMQKEVEKISCLAVMPVTTTVSTTRNMKFADAETLEKGADYLEAVVLEELNQTDVARIVTPGQLEDLLNEVPGGKIGLLKEVGKQVNCTTILYTTVQRFDQRQGGDFAVDSPASAAFEMRLVNVHNGSVLWSGNFNETQQSLLDNILTFNKAQSRGFKWITVEDLVRQGVHERISDCPYL